MENVGKAFKEKPIISFFEKGVKGKKLINKPKPPKLFANKLFLLTIVLLIITIALTVMYLPHAFLILGIGGPATFICGFVFLLMLNNSTTFPAKVELRANPNEIVADGISKSFITIQLLDKKGIPIPAQDDTEVKLTTTGGKLESALVKIPKGKVSAETVLISSKESGKINLAAGATGLESIDIKLNFKEKPRFCMHCGTMMLPNAKACQNCGKTPLAGTDTKSCQNCNAVIPIAAKFCSECGAGQKY